MMKNLIKGFVLFLGLVTISHGSEIQKEDMVLSKSPFLAVKKEKEASKIIMELDQKMTRIEQENVLFSNMVKKLKQDNDQKSQEINNLKKVMEQYSFNHAVQAGEMPVYYRAIRAEIILTTSLAIAAIASVSTLYNGGGLIAAGITFMGTFYTAYYFLKTARDIGTYASNVPVLKTKTQ